MEVKIYSNQQACGFASQEVDVPHLWISVIDPGDTTRLLHNPHRRGHLVQHFHDARPDEPGDWVLMQAGQAEAIVRFVMEHDKEVSQICVNCHAGICRSSAVAVSISEHYNGHDSGIWRSFEYYPNEHVYSLMKSAWAAHDKAGGVVLPEGS